MCLPAAHRDEAPEELHPSLGLVLRHHMAAPFHRREREVRHGRCPPAGVGGDVARDLVVERPWPHRQTHRLAPHRCGALEFRSGEARGSLVLAGLPLLARLPALLVREMLHPPLCNRRQSLNQNRGEHRPSHRHDWRRTVVQIGDAGVKVAIEYQCPVAGGERRVDREQVRSALVVVPALPTAMLRITAFRTIMQT